jgi:hypothetical protein
MKEGRCPAERSGLAPSSVFMTSLWKVVISLKKEIQAFYSLKKLDFTHSLTWSAFAGMKLRITRCFCSAVFHGRRDEIADILYDNT